MPPKRKRGDVQAQPSRPEAPRRRSRRVKEEVDNASASPYATKAMEAGEKKTHTVWGSKEGVQEAVQQLSQMEEELQSAVRRQRLAVENSDLGNEEIDTAQIPFQPRVIKSEKDTVNEEPANIPDEIEKAPVDGYEAELAAGDMAEAKGEDDKPERGAKRPPPVNSDVLPLPWKGRLGYVSK